MNRLTNWRKRNKRPGRRR